MRNIDRSEEIKLYNQTGIYHKKCCICKEIKPDIEFNKDKSRRDGLAGKCRNCMKLYDSKPEVRDKKKIHTKNWKNNNWEYVKQYMNNRYHDNIKIKLCTCVSTSLSYCLRRVGLSKQSRHWEDILGYTTEDLMNRLEPLFQDGMSWDNYGEWEIDHIIPISLFEIQEVGDDEFKRCWSLTNLQPLWAIDNAKKQNKILIP